jgi:DNA-binding IclR family transcriptional regulator
MIDQQRLMAAKKAVQQSSRTSEGGAQSIDRATMLLVLVGRAGCSGARLADLVAQSELAKPTVRRMLLALVRSGLLDQDESTRAYHIGPEVYALGTMAAARFGIHAMALRSLVRLSEQSGDSAFLSVPRDIYSICLHREDGKYPIRIQSLQAGDRHPLGVGAGSLAMLLAMTDAETTSIIQANLDEGLAKKHPNYSAARMRSMVQETRDNGFALNPGLMLTGCWAIGVAIRDASNRPIGALSIAAIEHRIKERQNKLVPLLQAEAAEVERRMTHLTVGRAGRSRNGRTEISRGGFSGTERPQC